MDYFYAILLFVFVVGNWLVIAYASTLKYHFTYLKLNQVIKYHNYHFTWDYSYTHFADLVIRGKHGKKIYINFKNKTCTPVPLDKH